MQVLSMAEEHMGRNRRIVLWRGSSTRQGQNYTERLGGLMHLPDVTLHTTSDYPPPTPRVIPLLILQSLKNSSQIEVGFSYLLQNVIPQIYI